MCCSWNCSLLEASWAFSACVSLLCVSLQSVSLHHMACTCICTFTFFISSLCCKMITKFVFTILSCYQTLSCYQAHFIIAIYSSNPEIFVLSSTFSWLEWYIHSFLYLSSFVNIYRDKVSRYKPHSLNSNTVNDILGNCFGPVINHIWYILDCIWIINLCFTFESQIFYLNLLILPWCMLTEYTNCINFWTDWQINKKSGHTLLVCNMCE
jgi:hypothetical protein